MSDVLEKYEEYITDKQTEIVLTIDKDDIDTVQWCKENIKVYPHLKRVQITLSKNKIQAANSGALQLDYDIICLSSDDMIPVRVGFDKIMIEGMQEYFPDLDGSLWYGDNLTAHKLITYPVLGRLWVEQFGYIYHPKYQGLFCDNELTDVGRMLGKLRRLDTVLLEHHHWTNKKRPVDDLYRKYAQDIFAQDKNVWKSRKAKRYDLI